MICEADFRNICCLLHISHFAKNCSAAGKEANVVDMQDVNYFLSVKAKPIVLGSFCRAVNFERGKC